MADVCELCEAARFTEWFYEDDECWVAECEACWVPMVVWRTHDAHPAPQVRAVLHERLAAVMASSFEGDFVIDDHLRTIPDHYHAHARPKGGAFGRGFRRLEG